MSVQTDFLIVRKLKKLPAKFRVYPKKKTESRKDTHSHSPFSQKSESNFIGRFPKNPEPLARNRCISDRITAYRFAHWSSKRLLVSVDRYRPSFKLLGARTQESGALRHFKFPTYFLYPRYREGLSVILSESTLWAFWPINVLVLPPNSTCQHPGNVAEPKIMVVFISLLQRERKRKKGKKGPRKEKRKNGAFSDFLSCRK